MSKTLTNGSYYKVSHYASNFTADEEKEFKKALFLSKGKTNNKLASYLIQCGLPAEQVIEIASNVVVDYESTDEGIIRKPRNRRRTSYIRTQIQQIRRAPNFFDTVSGKNEYVKKLILGRLDRRINGDDQKLLKEIGGDDYLPMSILDREVADRISVTSFGYATGLSIFSYDSTLGNYLPFAVNIAESGYADKLPERFLNDIYERTQRNDSKRMDVDGIPFEYDKYFKYDLDSLCNTDTPIEKINALLAVDTIVQAVRPDFGTYIRTETKIKTALMVSEFYHACKEMGIALVNLNEYNQWGATYSRIKALLRQTIKAYGQYKKLVEKEGFLMSVARQTIVEELNQYIVEHHCIKGNEVRWRFISRNDIKDEEPIVKKTKNTTTKKIATIKTFDSVEALEKYYAEQNKRKEEK